MDRVRTNISVSITWPGEMSLCVASFKSIGNCFMDMDCLCNQHSICWLVAMFPLFFFWIAHLTNLNYNGNNEMSDGMNVTFGVLMMYLRLQKLLSTTKGRRTNCNRYDCDILFCQYYPTSSSARLQLCCLLIFCFLILVLQRRQYSVKDDWKRNRI